MALSGLHVAAGKVGIIGAYECALRDKRGDGLQFPLLSAPIWSETLSTAGMTTKAAPSESIEQGQTIFTIRSGVEAWIAIGPNPNAAANPREVIGANQDHQRIVKAGDRLAWSPT